MRTRRMSTRRMSTRRMRNTHRKQCKQRTLRNRRTRRKRNIKQSGGYDLVKLQDILNRRSCAAKLANQSAEKAQLAAQLLKERVRT